MAILISAQERILGLCSEVSPHGRTVSGLGNRAQCNTIALPPMLSPVQLFNFVFLVFPPKHLIFSKVWCCQTLAFFLPSFWKLRKSGEEIEKNVLSSETSPELLLPQVHSVTKFKELRFFFSDMPAH